MPKFTFEDHEKRMKEILKPSIVNRQDVFDKIMKVSNEIQKVRLNNAIRRRNKI